VFQRAWFHVSADDERAASSVAGHIQRFATVRIVLSSRAPALTDTARFAGAICLGSEPSLARDEALLLKRAHPRMPVLAMLGDTGAPLLDPLQAAGVEVCTAGAGPASLVSFVQRALGLHFSGSPRVAAVVRALAEERKLTPRELSLLAYALGDESRARVRRRLGVSENTLKTEVRGLIRKCGARNTDALAKALLRTALGLANGAEEHPFATPFAPLGHAAAEASAHVSEPGLSTRASPARPYAARESA
jgi:DNA-binding NarL/FixJ family response regulator